MTMTINGPKCSNCGKTAGGVMPPESWWEGNIGYPADAVADGGGITLCGECFELDTITIAVPTEATLKDGILMADTRDATIDWSAYRRERFGDDGSPNDSIDDGDVDG